LRLIQEDELVGSPENRSISSWPTASIAPNTIPNEVKDCGLCEV